MRSPYVQLASDLKRGIDHGGDWESRGDDGDSDDDWDELELSEIWSENEDEQMCYDVYANVSVVKDKEKRGSFGGVERDHVPTPFDIQMKQPKISKDKLGSIFRAQQLVRHSLNI